MPAISVIIISYNSGRERLERALASLEAQTFRDFEIILFDNASSDGCTDRIAEADKLRIRRHWENLGFAGGVNAAAKSAKGEWLALLNPDATAAPDWLEKMYQATITNPHARSFGSVQINADDHDRLDGLGDVYHFTGIAWRGGFGQTVGLIPDEDRAIFAACGAGCLYHKGTFDKMGGYAEDFFCYHEDVDFGFRLQSAGYDCLLVHEAIIYHEGSGTTGRYSDFTIYHGIRNRIWTFRRNMPVPFKYALFPVHIFVNSLFLIRALINRHGAAYWRGMMDGLFKKAPENETQSDRGVMSKFSWSVGKMLTRSPDLR